MIFNHGVLGINARNLLYIKPYNPKKAIKMADDKMKTKHFLSARGIPVPRLYGFISKHEEVERFDYHLLPQQFVLKPNLGYGGEGIIPVAEREKGANNWFKYNGEKISPQAYKSHIKDIIDGRFSISGLQDCAFFEQLIVSDERIGRFAYKGLPDIRVIVYNLIPVMAMLRIPTPESEGKANLHLGAIGAGIDLAKGTVTHVLRGRKIVDKEYIGEADGLMKLKLPYWDDILYLASKIQLIANLGYLAVDLAIDKSMGPVLLEMNARAGLNVQIANLAPLRRRLQQVDGIKVSSPEKGVRMAKDFFGNLPKQVSEGKNTRPLIGLVEKIELILPNKIHSLPARIALNRQASALDLELAKNLGLINEQQLIDEEKISCRIKFQLRGKKVSTLAKVIDLAQKREKIRIGRRDLALFLIDPSLSDKEGAKLPNPEEVIARSKINEKIVQFQKSLNRVDYSEIDNRLHEIDKEIKLLHHLKPLNLEEELSKVNRIENYNPVFSYPELKFKPFQLKRELLGISIPATGYLTDLFKEKKTDIFRKILLLEHIGSDNFSAFSVDLYGKPDPELLEKAKSELKYLPRAFAVESAFLNADQAAGIFATVLKNYGLQKWRVKLMESLVADCVTGKKKMIFLKKSAFFSRERIKTLIAHEIETHVLSAENGKLQPYKIFNRGTADYLETQEGLAIYNQNRLLSPNQEKWYWPIASVLAVEKALHGSFSEVVALLLSHGFARERAVRVAVKVKRGIENTANPGAFTKDMLYYRGYLNVVKFLNSGGSLADLYLGKISLFSLPKIKKISGIVRPKYLPFWFTER